MAVRRGRFGHRYRWLALLLVAAVAMGLAPDPLARAAGRTVATRINPRPGRVALTFDDGPNPKWTPVILDVLDEYDVKATFFVNGFRVEAYPEVAAEVVRRGHSLQNHGYGHQRVIYLSNAGAFREIAMGAEAIFAATGARSTCFRPGWGLTNSRTNLVARAAGHEVVLWSVDSGDYAHQSGSGSIERVLRDLHSGDVILMHDSIGWAARDALPVIIEAVRAAGMEFDTLCDYRNDHLMWDQVPIRHPGIA